jgi:NAD(P)H-dependent FMN reductase
MKKIKENKLKITIIVFSPSGNTLTTAKLFEQSFLKRKAQVQLINFTRRKELADQTSIAKYLNDTVNPHDILCIGGPVYAGHLQENVKNIIKALPLPDEKWGSMVVPFISYGGVHSSVALKEAGILLRKRNRKNISGVKIAASHSLTKKFEFSINESKPGQEEIQVIEALADRVVETVGKEFEEKSSL